VLKQIKPADPVGLTYLFLLYFLNCLSSGIAFHPSIDQPDGTLAREQTAMDHVLPIVPHTLACDVLAKQLEYVCCGLRRFLGRPHLATMRQDEPLNKARTRATPCCCPPRAVQESSKAYRGWFAMASPVNF